MAEEAPIFFSWSHPTSLERTGCCSTTCTHRQFTPSTLQSNFILQFLQIYILVAVMVNFHSLSLGVGAAFTLLIGNTLAAPVVPNPGDVVHIAPAHTNARTFGVSNICP